MPPFLVRIGTLLAALAAGVPAAGQGAAIEHGEIGCMMTGRFPIVSACFTPASGIARARVYFRPTT